MTTQKGQTKEYLLCDTEYLQSKNEALIDSIMLPLPLQTGNSQLIVSGADVPPFDEPITKSGFLGIYDIDLLGGKDKAEALFNKTQGHIIITAVIERVGETPMLHIIDKNNVGVVERSDKNNALAIIRLV